MKCLIAIFMFDFSMFPRVFSTGTQNSPANFRNFGNFIPIYMWDTSMNLCLNSVIFCIQIFPLNEGHNFDPFSCSNPKLYFYIS